tara:strand:+ start:544 stop:1425 length:882 start_codon:yes stop_codon:yes gene_type:complete
MSNELVALMQNNPALVGTGLDEDTLAVSGGAGGNSKRISIKGGVFRKVVGGKEIAALEDRHMDVIFVKMAHKASRTLYAEGYQEGVKASPICWSTDSETPDADVKEPQSDRCKSCPNSIKGSSATGQGAACRLSWRTAVVLPNDPSGDVMQLVLPATSCFGDEVNGKYPFRPYIQMLANNNVSAGRVVTKMQFDMASPVPKLLFSPTAVVPPEDIAKVVAQSTGAAAVNAVKLTVFHRDEGQASRPQPKQRESVEETVSAEPKLQEPKQEPAVPTDKPDLSNIVNKWAKKKGA